MKKAVGMLAATLAVWTAVSCGERETTRTVTPVKVETVTVGESSTAADYHYVGVVEEDRSAALSFATVGTIRQIMVDEGQRVAQGQLLATLDRGSAQSTFDAAAASLHQAEDAYARMKQLYDKKSLPEMQMVEVETRLQQARSMYELSKKNMNDCALHAPFAGVVGRRTAEVGENASPGVPVLTLLEISRVKVRISVPENEIARLDAGTSAVITVSALGGKSFEGHGVEKSSAADAVTHTYDARITLPNPRGELLPGMVCDVVPTLSDSLRSGRITLPARAIQQAGDGSRFVWKVVGDAVMRCPVTTGEWSGSEVVITGGLEMGDKIVKDGFQRVSEGSKITE